MAILNTNLFSGNGLNLPTSSGNLDPNAGEYTSPGPSWDAPGGQPQPTVVPLGGSPPGPPTNTNTDFPFQPIPIGQGGPTIPNPTPGNITQSLPATLGLTPQQGARVTVNGQTFTGNGTTWTPEVTPPPRNQGAINTTTPATNPFAGTNPFIPTVTSPTVNPDGSTGAPYNFATPGNPNLNYATEAAARQVAQMFGLQMGTPYQGANPAGQASHPMYTVRLPNGDDMPAGQIIQWLNSNNSEADIRARLGLPGGSTHLGGYGAPGSPSFGPLNRNSFTPPSPVPASQMGQIPETFFVPNQVIPQTVGMNPFNNGGFGSGDFNPLNAPITPQPQAATLDPVTALLFSLFFGGQQGTQRSTGRQRRLPSYARTNLYPGL